MLQSIHMGSISVQLHFNTSLLEELFCYWKTGHVAQNSCLDVRWLTIEGAPSSCLLIVFCCIMTQIYIWRKVFIYDSTKMCVIKPEPGYFYQILCKCISFVLWVRIVVASLKTEIIINVSSLLWIILCGANAHFHKPSQLVDFSHQHKHSSSKNEPHMILMFGDDLMILTERQLLWPDWHRQ